MSVENYDQEWAAKDVPSEVLSDIQKLSEARATVDVPQEEAPGTRYVDW